jgi:carboxyl-terminal processing protease
MKSIKNNLLLLLIATLLTTPKLYAQQTNVRLQNKHIQQFIQIWGLVKYKSQNSIQGKLATDSLFLRLIDPVKQADDKHFNQLMLTLVDTVSPSTYDRKQLNSYQHLLKNVDYSWINRNKYTGALRQQLTALSNQVNLSGKHHYIPAVWHESDIPNEAPYTNYSFDNEEMNLLALAKAWNAIEYLFPYKYMIGKNWQQVLAEMIPVFSKINDRMSYEKGILQLAAAINDTHAGESMENGSMKMINTIFNVRYAPPFDYKVEAKSIIIKRFLSDSLAKVSSLRVGDEIVAINGIKIAQWLKERAALIPASNDAVKYRELSTADNNRGDTFAFGNVEEETLQVKIKRNGAYLALPLVLLDRQKKQHVKLIERNIINKRAQEKSIKGREDIGNDIALFRAGNFFDRDLPADKDFEQLAIDLKSKKAIIFDMRKYPQSPGLFSYYLPLLLGKAPFAFARYYAADPKDPGTFLHRAGIENYMYVAKDALKPIGALYTGKIVILTNEHTQSMAEWFAMMLRQLNTNTTVIGSQTAGADGDLKRLTLPGGYKFSFTGNGIFYPDGRETQRIGIVPDIYFKPSAKELGGMEDVHLQRALKYIREGK